MQPISMQSAPTLSHAASSKNVLQSRAPSEAGSCRSLLIEERVEPPGAEFKSPPSPSFPGAGAGAGALDDSSQPSSTGSRGKPPVDQWKANRIKGMMSQMSSFRYVGICRLPNVLSLVFTRICARARHNTGDCHYGNCGYTSHFSTGKYALGHVPEYTSLRNGRALTLGINFADASMGYCCTPASKRLMNKSANRRVVASIHSSVAMRVKTHRVPERARKRWQRARS